LTLLADWIPFLKYFPHLLVTSYLPSLMNIWSGSSYGSSFPESSSSSTNSSNSHQHSSDELDLNTFSQKRKVASLLMIHKICLSCASTKQKNILQIVFEGMYLRFAKRTRAVTIHNISTCNFLMNSLIEIYLIYSECIIQCIYFYQ